MKSLEVLIVDDSDIVLFLHTELLSYSGISTNPLTAINGQIALDLLHEQANPNKHYLVLLDINMPVKDGWQFLDEINKTEIPINMSVIMITSSIDQKDKKKANEYAQVIGFLEKPLSMESCRELKKLPQIQHFFTEN